MRKAKTKKNTRAHRSLLAKGVWNAFSRDDLKRVCEMSEMEFAVTYGMDTVPVGQRPPADYYHYRNNGSNVLAVAHLDTVVDHAQRKANFVDTAAGPVIFSGALDDRLGAYIILELLPKLGIQYDWLLTVGEETGQSTAAFFEPEKDYDYMIEFDRGGTDVVMYDYEDDATVQAVRDAGAHVGDGSFSDICYLEHLGTKGWNWGVGYRDYHSERSHAFLDDTVSMVAKYMLFHQQNEGAAWPHDSLPKIDWWRSYRDEAWLDEEKDDREVGKVGERECEFHFGKHGDDHGDCAKVLEEMGVGEAAKAIEM